MYRVWDDRNRELLIKTVTTWSNWTLIESWPGSILNFVTRRDSENWKLETCSYTNSMRWFWFSHREGSKTPPSLTSKSLGQDFGQDSEKKLWLGRKCPDSWPGLGVSWQLEARCHCSDSGQELYSGDRISRRRISRLDPDKPPADARRQIFEWDFC